MSDLRELLGDIAEEAKVYDVTGRAMRAARRRSRIRRYTPVAAVLVVVLVVVGIWIPFAPPREGSFVAGPVRWLPAVVEMPVRKPPILTDGRRVGRGSLLLRVRDWPDMILLTESGRYYTVPGAESISPDGRWLVLYEDGRANVRDLIKGDRWQLAVTTTRGISMQWSPDSRWLVLQLASDGSMDTVLDRTLVLMDATTWQSTLELTLSYTTKLLAVLDTGEFVTPYIHVTDDDPPLPLPSPLLLQQVSDGPRTLPLTLAAAAARPGEKVDSMPYPVLADGSTLLLQTSIERPAPGGTTSLLDDVLVLDSRSGAVRRRIELPDPVFADDGNGDRRQLAATAPEGILVWHHQPAAPAELELMDRVTGKLTVATRITDERIGYFYPRGFAR